MTLTRVRVRKISLEWGGVAAREKRIAGFLPQIHKANMMEKWAGTCFRVKENGDGEGQLVRSCKKGWKVRLMMVRGGIQMRVYYLL